MSEYRFHVAISFAGPQREHAKALAELLQEEDIKVFYDEFEPEELFGEDLRRRFRQIFGSEARLVVVIWSKSYAERLWPNREFKAVRERFQQQPRCLTVIRADDTDLPPDLSSIGYLDAPRHTTEEIARLICSKLLDDTKHLIDPPIDSPRLTTGTPHLTPEDPHDHDNRRLRDRWYKELCEEQRAVLDDECAWVIPLCEPIEGIELFYSCAEDKRYDRMLPPLGEAALERWSTSHPDAYRDRCEEPWGDQVRFDGMKYLHSRPHAGSAKYRFSLSPIKYLYYVALQARLWSQEPQAARICV